MHLSEIYLFPIKSLAGISVHEARLTRRGLEHDRRFMLVTLDGQMLTQRTVPKMALLQPELVGSNLVIYPKNDPSNRLTVPLKPQLFVGRQQTEIWGTACRGHLVDAAADRWFSDQLGQPCQLLYMRDEDERYVKRGYAKPDDEVSFADGYPYLIMGQAALDHLNEQLNQPVDADRFRANLLFIGGPAHAEDHWERFEIGNARFRGVKQCKRCQVPNINQTTAEMEREPNRTLATYRQLEKGKIYFGLNACWDPMGTAPEVVSVGQAVNVLKQRHR